MEQTLHLACQADQRVPGAVYREIVATRINHGDFPPILGHGAHHFQLAGEELLVQNGKRHVLFDGMDATQPQAKAIDIATEHAPNGAALRPSRQRLHGRDVLSIVAGRGVARHHDAIGRKIRGQRPGVLALAGITFPGASGDHPIDAASRTFAPNSFEK